MRNCWTYAIRQRIKNGGRIRIQWKAYGWVPRLKWQSNDGHIEYYMPLKRVKWETLPLYKKLFPLHILSFDGKVVREE